MAGILMSYLAGNLHCLSEQSFEKLKGYFEGNILSWQDHNLLLNDLTRHKVITPEQHSLALKNLTQQAETTLLGY
jgi:hypothetical protein